MELLPEPLFGVCYASRGLQDLPWRLLLALVVEGVVEGVEVLEVGEGVLEDAVVAVVVVMLLLRGVHYGLGDHVVDSAEGEDVAAGEDHRGAPGGPADKVVVVLQAAVKRGARGPPAAVGVVEDVVAGLRGVRHGLGAVVVHRERRVLLRRVAWLRRHRLG